ncbi:hypothetical protein [Paenibacillus sp. sgz500958]|uniref:hypothetical protein n=1 Tax=Paenibacillus sp. sgz500958 TaxID=3242475 RepID=UPI0036D38E3B
MDWFHDYEAELRQVFDECKLTISQFPEPLRTQGAVYLQQFDVFQTTSHKNYICYLLPYWLRESCRLPAEECRQMAKGNIFIMLYFFIQDDIMDNPGGSAASRLPLANLLYLEFLNVYHGYFPADSPFWTYFNRYITEWAESVSNESSHDYFLSEQHMLARKASPLKLSSTAALLLSSQISLVPLLENLLEHVLLTLQMLDDYEDWQEDLEQGSYNGLLALAESQLSDRKVRITTEEVRHFIFNAGGMKQYLRIAQDNKDRLPALDLPIPHLLAFHNDLVANLKHISETIEYDKQLLQNGGLSYWLSKHMTESDK